MIFPNQWCFHKPCFKGMKGRASAAEPGLQVKPESLQAACLVYWDQHTAATPGLADWRLASGVTLDLWGGAERSFCCRAGALGLPQRIWGVMRLSVIPHSGSSTWDLFSCWMGRRAAQEDSHFRPASVAVNASRQRRADTRPRVSSLNTPVWAPSLPLSHTHTERSQDTHTQKIMTFAVIFPLKTV